MHTDEQPRKSTSNFDNIKILTIAAIQTKILLRNLYLSWQYTNRAGNQGWSASATTWKRANSYFITVYLPLKASSSVQTYTHVDNTRLPSFRVQPRAVVNNRAIKDERQPARL